MLNFTMAGSSDKGVSKKAGGSSVEDPAVAVHRHSDGKNADGKGWEKRRGGERHEVRAQAADCRPSAGGYRQAALAF
jgi:hypothetical protein